MTDRGPSGHVDRVLLEARALAHVLALAVEDRPAAAAKLEEASYALRAWLAAVRRELEAAPAVPMRAVWAMLERAELAAERDALARAGVSLDALLALDPACARGAHAAVLSDAARAKTLGCARSARQLLERVECAASDTERRRLLLEAARECVRLDRDAEKPLSMEWRDHVEAAHELDPGPDRVLRLDPRRGPWAEWVNAWLGHRGGLDPGETLVIGGGWGAGKTSLAAVFVVDALSAGCPVLVWQLELGRARTLEHLQAQRIDLEGWPTSDFWARARADLPPEWDELLTIPRDPSHDAEALLEAMRAQALRAARMPHAVKGLVVVDYAQLLTVADDAPYKAQHEVIATAASWIAKAADETGACVVLLSQINKADQRTGTIGGTSLAGADLARMGSRVAIATKVDRRGEPYKDGGEPVDWDPVRGERRRLSWVKARGVRYTHGQPPAQSMDYWTGGRSRALQGHYVDRGTSSSSRGLAYE